MSASLDGLLAAIQAGGDATFGSLRNGVWFRFPRDPALMVKLSAGRYRLVGGSQVYRTGARTAVLMVDQRLVPNGGEART